MHITEYSQDKRQSLYKYDIVHLTSTLYTYSTFLQARSESDIDYILYLLSACSTHCTVLLLLYASTYMHTKKLQVVGKCQ